MEAYIRSKMARDEPATAGQADDDDDDDGAVAVAVGSLSAYAISEDVKALAKGDFELAANAIPSSRPRSGSDADTTPAGQGATVSALLAEVALPDKYRHKSIRTCDLRRLCTFSRDDTLCTRREATIHLLMNGESISARSRERK